MVQHQNYEIRQLRDNVRKVKRGWHVENLFRTRMDQGLETHLFDVVIDLEQHDLGNPLSAAAARAVIAVEDAFTDYANADLDITEPGETTNGPAPEL